MDNFEDINQWTISSVLRTRTTKHPEKIFCEFDNKIISYQSALSNAGRVANYLDNLSLVRGETIAVMLDNTVEFCYCWLGISLHGSIHVAVNTDYKATFLKHVLNNSKAAIIIVEADYVERIKDIASELLFLKTIVINGCPSYKFEGFKIYKLDAFTSYPNIYPEKNITYRDTACIMYTSGTTGPSKGVLMTHAHVFLFGLGTIEHMGLCSTDRFYIVLPLFHANGLFMQLYATLIAGAFAYIRRRFSARRWLTDIRDNHLTITNSLGAIASYVLEQPQSRFDKDHHLRIMSLAPTSAKMESELKARFAIESVIGLYGMTEINIPLYAVDGVSPSGSCGRVWHKFYELLIVDELTDEKCRVNEVGEIVVRPRQAYAFMSGYLGMPDKTIEAWRNFWFHTGDAARMDENGNVFFVDRIKDCIRRKGENISSFDVEAAMLEFSGIEEIAAYAVPSDQEAEEDEVMVAIVKSTTIFNFNELLAHARDVLPKFAVPRFYRLVDELPKTPTGKIQKVKLKSDGKKMCDFIAF